MVFAGLEGTYAVALTAPAIYSSSETRPLPPPRLRIGRLPFVSSGSQPTPALPVETAVLARRAAACVARPEQARPRPTLGRSHSAEGRARGTVLSALGRCELGRDDMLVARAKQTLTVVRDRPRRPRSAPGHALGSLCRQQ